MTVRLDRDDAVVAALFVASRAIVLGVLGVRMEAGFLGFAPQYPDVGLLQHHLVQTTFYEHTQPPLFPFLLGSVLKLSPFPDGVTLQGVYLALGLVLALLLRRVFRRLGLGRWAALAAAGLVVIHPSLVVLENVPSYDYPTAVLLAWLVKAFLDHVRQGGVRTFALVLAATSALVLLRSSFHPVFFVVVTVVVLVLRPPPGGLRSALLVAVLPALLIVGFMVKNQVLYGQFGLSTWFGPSLSKVASSVVDARERNELVRAGEVSALFGRPVFLGYDTYAADLPPCRVTHGAVPVLADPVRPRSGTPNLNYECQLAVYGRQGSDARWFIRHRPRQFVTAEVGATQMFFEPASPIIYSANVKRLSTLDDLYQTVVFGRVKTRPVVATSWGDLRTAAFGGSYVLVMAVVDVAVVVVVGAAAAGRHRRGQRKVSQAGWVFVALVCVWTTASGSLLEINENARFRLPIDPFLIAASVLVVTRVRTAVTSRRRAGPRPAGSPISEKTVLSAQALRGRRGGW